MKSSNPYLQDLTRGIVKENPVFVMLLGMCPVLGVTAFIVNGFGMGLAATAVLICSNLVVSLLRNYIPPQVRIPCFIVIIATFVTIIEMVLKAFQPVLYDALGVFVPLIVVNCIILGRAEAFASKRPVLRSLMDGIGMGIGLTLALVILSTVREVIGQGTILGPDPASAIHLFGSSYEPMALFALPPGAFIALGFLLAIVNVLFKRFNIK
ncbi:MAG: electron transport complex subunit E [Bacillota bacterium]|jgi:Na+-translocating ferredoxin:NAD+ oxidoreductase subunit E|nr:electron transport complex subunit E [Bacillota bacterium]